MPLTLDGLLLVEIVNHGLNSWVQRLDIFQNVWLILQDQFAGCVWPLRYELLQVVPFVSTNIHEENVFFAGLCSLDESLYRVEISIHPAGPTLVVGRHEIVELSAEFRIVGVLAVKKFEERIVGLES